MKRYALAALAFIIAPNAAQAFDCAKASTKVERAICADPALKDLDDIMSAAYGEVRSASSASERKMLALAQKRWLAARESQCIAEDKLDTACVRDRTDQRRRVLLGEAKSGPGASSRMMPVFLQQEGGGKITAIDYTLTRFVAPKTAGEKKFNAEIQKILKDAPGPDTEAAPEGMIYSADAAMDVDYASPRFLSASVLVWSFRGGAHGNGGVSSINIDMKRGKIATYGDLFELSAVKPLAAECRKQIIAEKKERAAGEIYDPANDPALTDEAIVGHIEDLATWSFTAGQASVNFNAYDIGAYAEGPFDCDFPIPMLRGFARPGAPFPG